jgi:hypothetical protein
MNPTCWNCGSDSAHRRALSEIRAMAATLAHDHAEIVGLRAIAVIADLALGEREIDHTRHTPGTHQAHTRRIGVNRENE